MNFNVPNPRIISVNCNYPGYDLVFDCFSGDFQTAVLQNNAYWERHIMGFISKNMSLNRPFFDIGANIGFHSIMCQKIITEKTIVVAVEPHPTILSVLKKNRSQNNCDFHIVEAACWDSNGYLEMRSELGSDTGDTFVSTGDLKIPAVLIDDLADKFGHPQIIKIDIQGFEADAILGAKKTIQRGDVFIILEFAPKLSKRSSNDLMKSFEIFEKNNYVPNFFRASPGWTYEMLTYDILRSLSIVWSENGGAVDLIFRQN